MNGIGRGGDFTRGVLVTVGSGLSAGGTQIATNKDCLYMGCSMSLDTGTATGQIEVQSGDGSPFLVKANPTINSTVNTAPGSPTGGIFAKDGIKVVRSSWTPSGSNLRVHVYYRNLRSGSK